MRQIVRIIIINKYMQYPTAPPTPNLTIPQPVPEQIAPVVDPLRRRITTVAIVIGIVWYIYQWIDSLPCPEDACEVHFGPK